MGWEKGKHLSNSGSENILERRTRLCSLAAVTAANSSVRGGPPGPGRWEGSPPVWGLQTGGPKTPWRVPPLVAGIHSERPKMVQAPHPHTSLSDFPCSLRTQKCGLMDVAHYFREDPETVQGSSLPSKCWGGGDWVGACDRTGQLPGFRAAGGGSPLPAWPWPEARQHSILPFRGLPPHSNRQLGLRWALFPGQGSWSPLTLRFWVETI